MSKETGPDEDRNGSIDPPAPSTLVVWGLATIFLLIVIGLTAPFSVFLAESSLATISAAHGTLATLGVIVGTISGYLVWRLFVGKIKAFTDLKVLSLISAIIAGLTVIIGNMIYIAYRAPGGPRAFFVQNNPAVHEIFFEFKEFIALFPFPIAVATTYIIWAYKEQLTQDRGLRSWLGIAIAIAWGALMIAYLLGAAITKLRSV
ncbi:MAG: hypothetical protein HYU39_04090 [Thaumarchaeota archaeon]|nr:hypothetical protein [Nitrososphaerota archaeon]